MISGLSQSKSTVGDDDAGQPSPALVINARSVLAAVSWSGVGQVGSQVAWFGSLIALGAMLPPRAFGTVAAGMVIVYLTSLMYGPGTLGSIIAGRELTRRQVRGTVLYNIATGTLLTLALAAAAGPVIATFAHGGNPWVLRALALGILVNSLSIVPQALLQKRMEYKRQAAVRTAAAACGGLGAVAAAVAGAGVWALVLRIVLNNACIALFAWIAARDLVPAKTVTAEDGGALKRLRRHGARWFVVLAGADFLAMSVDNLIVGHLTDSTRLGLYSLAFTLAFAPLTQFSWQVGGVLFTVTAATDAAATVARRTLRAVRMTALVLLPVVPPALVLAPVVVPAVLGQKWNGMVAPFQILLLAGVLYALTNMLGESLSGTGNVAFRGRVHVAWSLGTVAAIFLLVKVDGIRGAALGHLLLAVPLALAYALPGIRKIGTDVRELWRALRDIVWPVAAQAATTAGLVVGLREAGLPDGVAAGLAATAGVLVLVALLLGSKSSPLHEGKAMVASALRGSPAA
jgi:O-antigen/teichoic acid export membrane protein